MIKQGLKNFGVSLKHFFTPLGALFLGVVIGLSILVPGAFSCVKDMAHEIETYSEEIEIDFGAVKDALWDDVQALPWDTPSEALDRMTSTEWLRATFTDCLNGVLGVDSEQYAQNIETTVDNALARLKRLLILCGVFCVLGLIGGHLLTQFLIRRQIAPRPFWKFFLDALLDALSAAVIVIVCGLIGQLWLPGAILAAVLSQFLYGAAALWKAAVLHVPDKGERKRVFNIKNVGLLLVTNLLIVLFALLGGILFALLFNFIVGIFVSVPLFEIALCVIDMNAEAYALSVVRKDEKQTPDGAAGEKTEACE